MFEEEAEEYLKKDGTKAEQILNALNEISPLKITLKQLPFILAVLEQAFKDGAEVGYNKAKEWHFMKDGDLPKNNTQALVLLENKRMKISIFMENKFTVWNKDYNTYTKLYNVIAWKEIELPEEVKENE